MRLCTTVNPYYVLEFLSTYESMIKDLFLSMFKWLQYADGTT